MKKIKKGKKKPVQKTKKRTIKKKAAKPRRPKGSGSRPKLRRNGRRGASGKVLKSSKIEKPIGVVTHFYTAIKVAIVKFKKPVRVGARIKFKGATTDFEEAIKSMQYDHKPVVVAPKGKQMGIKVGKRVREGDQVFEVK